MPFATFSLEVDASVETLWAVLVDKVENPTAYTKSVESFEILERDGDTLVRRMVTVAGEVTERIRIDHEALRVDSQFVDHFRYRGAMVKKIVRPQTEGEKPALTYTLDWERCDGKPDDENLIPVAMAGVKHTKEIAEQRERA